MAKHIALVTEEPNGALHASCTCGWDWGYATSDEVLASEAAQEHEDEMEEEL